MTERTEPRPLVKAVIDRFIHSEFFSTWQAERVESGGYARPGSDDRDRFNRCYAAAEFGADGSTHREHIDDMRAAFKDYVRTRPGKRNSFWELPYRLMDAAEEYFDRLEQWHTVNGSIDQEVG